MNFCPWAEKTGLDLHSNPRLEKYAPVNQKELQLTANRALGVDSFRCWEVDSHIPTISLPNTSPLHFEIDSNCRFVSLIMSGSVSLIAETSSFVVGNLISTFLLGMLLHQCYTYFVTFQEDRRIFKYAVLFLLMLNIAHTALCQLTVWHLAVRHLFQESEWRQPRWLFAFYPPLCGIASCLVQIFYAHRIYLFSQRNLVISGLVTFGSLFQLTWSMLAAVRIFTVKEISDFRSWKYGVACWLGTAAATDFLVTSSMLWLLLKARGKIQKTNTIIDQLIALTVGTNILTFTVGLSDLMLFCFYHTPAHVSTNLCLLKLYSSSLLFWLNARPRLLEKFGGGILIEDCELITNNQNETCEQGEIGGFDKELNNQEPGIRVVTTASLRADQVPFQDIFSGPRTLDSNKMLGNLSRGWRADDQNGFTIQIIGGRNLPLKKGT